MDPYTAPTAKRPSTLSHQGLSPQNPLSLYGMRRVSPPKPCRQLQPSPTPRVSSLQAGVALAWRSEGWRLRNHSAARRDPIGRTRAVLKGGLCVFLTYLSHNKYWELVHAPAAQWASVAQLTAPAACLLKLPAPATLRLCLSAGARASTGQRPRGPWCSPGNPRLNLEPVTSQGQS